MINCNENENEIEKQIMQLIDIEADMVTNKQNIGYLGKIMSMCNKQHLSNIWG